MFRSKWLVLGAALGCLSAAGMVACGGTTATGTTGTSAGGDSNAGGGGASATTGGAGGAPGTTTTGDTSSSNASTGDTSSSSSTGDASSSGSGMLMCGPGQMPQCSCPGKLYPPKPATTQTVYCPFSKVGMGKDVYCNNESDAVPQKCCETPPAANTPSTCVSVAAACPVAMSTPWECADPGDCGSGKRCCGMGTFNANPSFPTCDNFASKFKGTYCAASCAAGEITMCTSDAECASANAGTKCSTMSPKGNHVGACAP